MENINFVAAKMEAAAASYREGQHRLTLTVVQNYDSAQWGLTVDKEAVIDALYRLEIVPQLRFRVDL